MSSTRFDEFDTNKFEFYLNKSKETFTNLLSFRNDDDRFILYDYDMPLDFIKEQLELYPIDLFLLNDIHGNIIIHPIFKPDFIEEYLEKYPINLFNLKDKFGEFVLNYSKFDEGFKTRHREFCIKHNI
jgi:hypothetical protein